MNPKFKSNKHPINNTVTFVETNRNCSNVYNVMDGFVGSVLEEWEKSRGKTKGEFGVKR